MPSPRCLWNETRRRPVALRSSGLRRAASLTSCSIATKCAQQFIVKLMFSDGWRNEERIIRSPTTLTRWSERLLLANIHSNGRSCSLAALKEVATTALAIFAGGNDGGDDDDDDVIYFAFLHSVWRHIKRLEEMSSKRWCWHRIDCECHRSTFS